MKKIFGISIFLFIFLFISQFSLAIPALNEGERDSIRFQLQSISNELELLHRNKKVNQADLKKLEANMDELKVYDRIPFQRDTAGLQKQLEDTSKEYQVQLGAFKTIKTSSNVKPIPASITATDSSFKLSQDQLVETIYFELNTLGEKKDLNRWVHSWKDSVLRLVELNGRQAITQTNRKAWVIRAKTYRFRDIQFPHIRINDPRSILPAWARKDYAAFSQSETLIHDLINRIEAQSAASEPLFEIKEKFLLNDARMNFYLLVSGSS